MAKHTKADLAPILKLPVELHVKIHENLRDASSSSLAVTCRILYLAYKKARNGKPLVGLSAYEEDTSEGRKRCLAYLLRTWKPSNLVYLETSACGHLWVQYRELKGDKWITLEAMTELETLVCGTRLKKLQW